MIIGSNKSKKTTGLQRVSNLQDKCLSSTYDDCKTSWNNADINKDGSVDYREGWLDVETSYYDSVIKCYNDYRTNDSESMIANYEQKKQQNYDRYNSLIQSTNNNRSKCISSVVGDSLYTIQQPNEDTIDYVCNFITMPTKLWRDSAYQSKQAFPKNDVS